MGTELGALKEERSPMNRPSGVRAAETMTTGSETVAMVGVPQIFALGKATSLHDDNHMMRCKNYNGNEGIICREVDRPGRPVQVQHPQLSSSAKADDPVNAYAIDYWMPRFRGA
jgi:hypothetical protein